VCELKPARTVHPLASAVGPHGFEVGFLLPLEGTGADPTLEHLVVGIPSALPLNDLFHLTFSRGPLAADSHKFAEESLRALSGVLARREKDYAPADWIDLPGVGVLHGELAVRVDVVREADRP
jgi:hypothetical protein